MRTSTSASPFPCCRRVQAIKGHSYHVEQSLPPTRQALLNTGRVDDAFDWLVSMMAPEAWDRACSRSPPGCKASEVSQEMSRRKPALARKFSFCIRTILQVDRGDIAVMPCFANKQPQRRRRPGERMFKMWNAGRSREVRPNIWSYTKVAGACWPWVSSCNAARRAWTVFCFTKYGPSHVAILNPHRHYG